MLIKLSIPTEEGFKTLVYEDLFTDTTPEDGEEKSEELLAPTWGEVDISIMEIEDAPRWRQRQKWRERNKAERLAWLTDQQRNTECVG